MRAIGIFFLVIGIISVLLGLFFLVPLIWGIPLTVLGIIMASAGAKSKRRKKRAGIEVRIRKLEFKKTQGKLEPARADKLIDKLRIQQAKYLE